MDAAVTGERVLYVYGVIPRDQELPNEAGAAVQAVSHAAIVALVEPVGAREFSPDTLNDKLKSIEWVASLAHKHEDVLECAMRQGPVVPARLCTLFSNTDSLRRSLAENEARFLAALEQVTTREEWGIKVYCDQGRLQAMVGLDDAQALALDAAVAKASPGQAFVLRKKRDARLAEAAAARIDSMTDHAIEALEHDAADVRLRPLLSEEATGRAEPMVLNVAALVDIWRGPGGSGEQVIDVRPIRTLEDVIHAVTNSLSLISSHSQYLLGKLGGRTPGKDEIQIIYEEAERAASLLSLVPQGLAQIPIQDPTPADSRPAARPARAGDVSHAKGRR